MCNQTVGAKEVVQGVDLVLERGAGKMAVVTVEAWEVGATAVATEAATVVE